MIRSLLSMDRSFLTWGTGAGYVYRDHVEKISKGDWTVKEKHGKNMFLIKCSWTKMSEYHFGVTSFWNRDEWVCFFSPTWRISPHSGFSPDGFSSNCCSKRIYLPKNCSGHGNSWFLIGHTSSNGWFSLIMVVFGGCKGLGSPKAAGLHAMLIVGYNDRQEASLGRGSGSPEEWQSCSFPFRYAWDFGGANVRWMFPKIGKDIPPNQPTICP